MAIERDLQCSGVQWNHGVAGGLIHMAIEIGSGVGGRRQAGGERSRGGGAGGDVGRSGAEVREGDYPMVQVYTVQEGEERIFPAGY
jgi:hypothetical protein